MNVFKPTALYEEGFTPTGVPGVYSLRVYTGGFAGVSTATERATKEAQGFLNGSRYSNFRILGAVRKFFPLSYVDFRVEFSPIQKEGMVQLD